MSQVLLFVDLASQQPSFALSYGGQPPQHKYQPALRDEVGWHIDALTSYLHSHSLTLRDIDAYLFCRGPGPFSALRVSCILGSLLLRELGDRVIVHSFHLLEICGQQHQQTNKLKLKAGLRGWYIWDRQLSERIQLYIPGISEIPDTDDADLDIYQDITTLISDPIQAMHKLYQEGQGIRHLSADDLEPLYIRQPNISRPKSKK